MTGVAPAPVVSAAMVQEAAERITGRARRTPVIDWSVRAEGSRVEVTLKLELLQHVGVVQTERGVQPDPFRAGPT